MRSNRRYMTKIIWESKISRKERINQVEKEIDELVKEINWLLEDRPRSNPKSGY